MNIKTEIYNVEGLVVQVRKCVRERNPTWSEAAVELEILLVLQALFVEAADIAFRSNRTWENRT